MTAIAVHSPVIEINGTQLGAQWLASLQGLRIEQAFGLVGRMTLRFTDPGYGLSTTNVFALGVNVKISLSTGDALFAGDVTGVHLDQSVAEAPELLVTVDDLAYRLGRATQVKTYSQVTFGQVVTKIAQAAGMRATVPGGGETFPYLLQSGSDLHYLGSLVERNGYVWWVNDKSLTVANPLSPTATVALTLGQDLTEFSVSATGLRPDEVTVTGWNQDRKQPIVGKSGPPAAAPSQFVSNYAKPSAAFGGAAVASAADRNPTTDSEATTLAKSLYNDWQAGTVITRGRTEVNAAIGLGSAVKVSNAGPTSGTYIITSVEHSYGRHGFTTRFTTGQLRPAGLVDTLGTNAAEAGSGFNTDGLIVGLVTNMYDPDRTGRVKVKYASITGEIESNWARVLVIGAGPNRGVVFQPEVNDEVLVGFERGDPRRPVVLGGLFSKKSTPPWAPEQGQHDIRSRRLTSRLGHMIEMGDGQGPADQHLLLELKSGHRLRLGEDRFDVDIKNGKPLLIKVGAAKIDISGQGDVVIEGTNISLKATQNVKIEGLQVDIDGKTQASLQAATVAIKAKATTSVEASGPLTLKGATVAIN